MKISFLTVVLRAERLSNKVLTDMTKGDVREPLSQSNFATVKMRPESLVFRIFFYDAMQIYNSILIVSRRSLIETESPCNERRPVFIRRLYDNRGRLRGAGAGGGRGGVWGQPACFRVTVHCVARSRIPSRYSSCAARTTTFGHR
jgi:hypothetical protein